VRFIETQDEGASAADPAVVEAAVPDIDETAEPIKAEVKKRADAEKVAETVAAKAVADAPTPPPPAAPAAVADPVAVVEKAEAEPVKEEAPPKPLATEVKAKEAAAIVAADPAMNSDEYKDLKKEVSDGEKKLKQEPDDLTEEE